MRKEGLLLLSVSLLLIISFLSLISSQIADGGECAIGGCDSCLTYEECENAAPTYGCIWDGDSCVDGQKDGGGGGSCTPGDCEYFDSCDETAWNGCSVCDTRDTEGDSCGGTNTCLNGQCVSCSGFEQFCNVDANCCGGAGLFCDTQANQCACPDGQEFNTTTGACEFTSVSSCGNGVIDDGEECDGSALGGETCENQGWDSGTLSCDAFCQFDTNQCVGCGDGVLDTSAGEECDDGNNLDGDGCSAMCEREVCVLTSASWSKQQAVEGEDVDLIVEGVGCDGEEISFAVWEYDTTSADDPVVTNPSNVVFSGTTATGTWTAEWQADASGDPEYYFIGTVVGTSEEIETDKDTGSLLHVSLLPVEECSSVAICADYGDEGSCVLDRCDVAENSLQGTVDCGEDNITCACEWDTTANECDAVWGVVDPVTGEGVGKCTYTQTSDDTCEDDGFLTFSWTAVWTPDPECDATCQAENADKEAACTDGQKTVECPAQILLPFFDAYNVIIALIIIGLIYWAISVEKGKSRKKRKGEKK